MEKSSDRKWTYSKRGKRMPRRTVENIKFHSAVRKKPQAVWAYEIEQKIKNRSLACWVASVIWFAFGSKARRGGKLFELMDEYRPSSLKNIDLGYALQLLKLPKI